MDAQDYTEHLHALAETYGCGLRLEPNLPGMMYVEFGYVEGPDPRRSDRTPQECFMVGLHEIGHFVHDHTQGRPPASDKKAYFENGVLRSEAQAWEFALDVAQDLDVELESDTRAFMWNVCLNSYLRASRAVPKGTLDRLTNGDRGYVRFLWDEPDEFFDSVRDRIIRP